MIGSSGLSISPASVNAVDADAVPGGLAGSCRQAEFGNLAGQSFSLRLERGGG
jgi:hypothetical protein